MIPSARALARLVGTLLLIVLAVGGIVVAVFCIPGDEETLSLPHLASLLHLDELRSTIGGWFEGLEASGPDAALAALCGLGAIALGLLLLIGAIVPGRDRLLTLDEAEEGRLTAQRRPTQKALESLAERPGDVLAAKARVRPHRTGRGGRASLVLTKTKTTDETPRGERARADLQDLEQSLDLTVSTHDRRPRKGTGVQ
jgi:hypothetical protein